MDGSSGPYPTYLGVWTNWSRGPVMGLTLTMTRNNADLLIALVAFYVAFVGGRVWRIFCFACHSIASSKSNQPRDGTYHQHQVIMRNSPSATNAVVALVQVLWAWRSTKGRPMGILVISLLLAAFFSLAFVVASGFSSRISTLAGDEVLIASTRCGYLQQGKKNFDGFMGVYSPHISKLFLNAANYAQECYGESTSGLLGCNTFVKQAIPFTVDTNAPCPFAPELCRTNTSNIRLDTGLLNSNDHIGLNAKPEDRVLWRRVLHCAPLVTEGYKTRKEQSFNVNNSRVSKPMVRYHYGKSAALDSGPESAEDFTYEYVDETQWDFNMSLSDNSYSLSATGAYTNLGDFVPTSGGYTINGTRAPIGFHPIPGLTSVIPDADVAILFLSSNGMPFIDATTDEWYRATTEFRNLSIPRYYNASAPAYLQDEQASPLGCLEQRQFCSPRNQGEDGQPLCTPLSGIWEVPYVTEPIVKDIDGELNHFKWFHNIATSPQDTISHLVSFLHATILQSRLLVSRNAQGPLPDNQWQIEVQHMFSTLLASVQQAFVHAAAVPNVTGLDEFIVGPASEESTRMCQNQKVRSNSYASFSLFGLLFTVIAGLVIVLISYLLEPIAACFHRRGKYNDQAYYEWMSNSSFQLQRLAHQGVGAGTWTGVTDDIPITKAGDKLAVLDFSDPTMPFLKKFRNGGGEGNDDEEFEFIKRGLIHSDTLVGESSNGSVKSSEKGEKDVEITATEQLGG